MTQRDLADAFVDTYSLEDVAPIRAQMPMNFGDDKTNLLAGLRVDNFAAITAGGPYATLEEMLAAFYANQLAFNADPSRNQIKMHGAIHETVDGDGTVLVNLDITYKDLPLNVFTADSFQHALFDQFDPARAVKRLGAGLLDGRLQIEMVLPSPGAPLHFWNADGNGDVRRLDFAGHGSGWLLDEAGERIGRGAVDIDSATDSVLLSPIEDRESA